MTAPRDPLTADAFLAMSAEERAAVIADAMARLVAKDEERKALTRAVRQRIADQGGRPVNAPALSYLDRLLIAAGLDPESQPPIQDWVDGKWNP